MSSFPWKYEHQCFLQGGGVLHILLILVSGLPEVWGGGGGGCKMASQQYVGDY